MVVSAHAGVYVWASVYGRGGHGFGGIRAEGMQDCFWFVLVSGIASCAVACAANGIAPQIAVIERNIRLFHDFPRELRAQVQDQRRCTIACRGRCQGENA